MICNAGARWKAVNPLHAALYANLRAMLGVFTSLKVNLFHTILLLTLSPFHVSDLFPT